MTDSNPFDVDDVDEDAGASRESQSFKDLRKWANQRDKVAKQYETEIAELKEFKAQVVAERTEQKIAQAFQEVNLNPAHTKLFRALNPDIDVEAITAETVAKFAAEYALVSADGGEVPAPEDKPAGYKPVVTGQGAPLKQYTQEEIDTLLAQGKHEEVNEAYRSGRVIKESAPWSR